MENEEKDKTGICDKPGGDCSQCSVDKMVEEIRKLEFSCQAGPLEKHRGFAALVKKARLAEAVAGMKSIEADIQRRAIKDLKSVLDHEHNELIKRAFEQLEKVACCLDAPLNLAWVGTGPLISELNARPGWHLDPDTAKLNVGEFEDGLEADEQIP